MKRILIILFILGIAISSCKVGPDYQRKAYDFPGQYRFSDGLQDSLINLKWWEMFSDPQLKALIETALKNNRDVRIAASRVDEARAYLGYNKADQYPVFGYDMSAGRGNVSNGGMRTEEAGNAFSVAPNLFWELDFWGKYRRAAEAAQAELLASQYGHRTVIIGLISEISATWFQLLDYHSRLEISRRTLSSRTESRRIIEERYKEGIVPELDLNHAQMQEAVAAASVPFYERQLAITENYLSILTGMNPGGIPVASSLESQSIPPEIPAGIPSDIMIRRPDVLQAEQLVAAQNARIGVAEAMRFPSISLTGLFGVASNELSSLVSGDAVIWSVSGGILGPIFNFGKNKRRVEIEKERTEQAYMMYENTVLQAFREVEDALVEIRTISRELEAREAQNNAARNAATLSQERYNGGVTSYLEVLESERSFFDAELALSQTRQQRLNAYVRLYKALGGGWISETEAKTN